jgi:hypothetical protein
MEKEILSLNFIPAEELVIMNTQNRLHGTYCDKPVDIKNTETIVLRLIDGQWKITHIH